MSNSIEQSSSEEEATSTSSRQDIPHDFGTRNFKSQSYSEPD
jgi:hypothetical protein